MIVFLIAIAAVSICLLARPEALARSAERLHIYVPFLELAKTRTGILQMRVLGFVLLLVTLVAASLILKGSQ